MSTVVVVEDDQALRELFQGALRRAGYTVVAVEDGASALAISESMQDGGGIVLLTDVRLPGINGCDLATEFVRHHPTARVGMMSGCAIDPAPAGIDVLLKPFTIPELLDFVAKIASESVDQSRGCYPC